MVRVAAVVAVIAVAATAVLVGARVLGVSGQAAPESRIYVAISRSDDETAAREIEVIDTATGERTLFDIGFKITALALAPDRRTLFVGIEDGRVLLYDPSTGGFIAEVRTRRATALVPDGDELYVVSADREARSVVARIDVRARKEIGSVTIAGYAGAPSLVRGELAVPFVDGARNALVRLSTPSLEQLDAKLITLVLGRTVYGLPQTHAADGAVAYLGQWDSQRPGARLTVLDAAWAPQTELVLPVTQPGSDRPLRGLLQVNSAVAALPGAIHACVGNAELAARYVVREGRAERVGNECGVFAATRAGLYLAVRGKGRVAVLDAATGRKTRDLLLPGIPVAIVG